MTAADSVVIREARVEDAEAISALILSLARYFLADPHQPEAATAFLATLDSAAMAQRLADERYRYHVAEADGVVAGVVGVRDADHLYHLFVAERFHGRGIGARLWDAAQRQARAQGNPGRFTVNSSLYAVPVYERMGFTAVDGPQVHDGIAYLPMRMDRTGSGAAG
ncbi:MAG TPA: GNAT family N-acetyltransferase [Longimicrobium sp.]|nr:GNAT family N-acetyltransferase [Longimicrobium sp.]